MVICDYASTTQRDIDSGASLCDCSAVTAEFILPKGNARQAVNLLHTYV